MVGSITSQGDRALKSNVARSIFHLDGKGIAIGVISDSFNALKGKTADVVSGDLPGQGNPNGFVNPVRVLKDSRNGYDEGRAMLQIVHDIAPGAELLFHSSGETEKDFATAVQALVRAGADVIVDDIGFVTEPFFQDGIAAQAVTAAANQGILCFSSAGNDGTRAYQSPFQSGTTFTFRGSTYEAHDFDSGAGVDLFQDIQMSKQDVIELLLNWDQPLGQVTTDLEMFLLDGPQLPGAGSKLLAQDSLLLPDAANDPEKGIFYEAPSKQTVYLLIARKTDANSTAPGLMQWISFANTADLGTTYQYVNDTPSAMGNSTIYGHPNAAGSIAVGAAFYGQTPVFSGKPPILEKYSAQGGTPILFNSQGDRLPAPEVRQKPELVAIDGVSTTVPGFAVFLGTSAAAPHAAAVAALMLQRAGGAKSLTRLQILAAMQKSAIPSKTSNLSNGAGLLQAKSAVIDSFLSQQIGTSGNDTIRGNETAENLLGLDGNDDLKGAGGDDALFGGQGQDRLQGNANNDYLLGGEGNDILAGNGDDDTLLGSAGNDVLMGGAGKNRSQGGAGKDTFGLQQSGFVVIQDFRSGQDRLGLSGRLTFDQLNFVQQGSNTVIMFYNHELATLNSVAANSLTLANFTAIKVGKTYH